MTNREIPIATATTRTSARWKNTHTTKQDMTEKAYQPHVINLTTAEYHALAKGEKDKHKDVGGFVGGHLKDGRRRKGHVLTRSFITLDIDNLPADVDLPAHLANMPFAWLAHPTLSHTPDSPRWRLWVWLTRDVNPDEYGAISRRIAQDINPGLAWLDQTTHQPERFFYWPATTTDGDYQAHVSSGKPELDPDEVLARYADWREVSTWPGIEQDEVDAHQRAQRHNVSGSGGKYEDPRAKPGMIGAFNRAYSVDKAISTFLPEVYKPGTMAGRYTYTGGTSSNGLVVYDGGLIAFSQHATDPAHEQRLTAFDLVRTHLFGHLDTDVSDTTPINRLPSTTAMNELANNDKETKLENSREIDEKINEVFAPIPTAGEQAQAPEDIEVHDNTEWRADLETQAKSGKYTDTIGNFHLIFMNDPRYNTIAWNEHANQLEVQDPQALPWKQLKPGWSDNDEAQLKTHIADDFKGIYGPQKMHDALMAAATTRSFHPVRDYFRELQPWDGIPRLDTLLVDYLGADDSEYVREVTRKTLVAAVRRTFRPGTKFDQVLTLVGPQGIGKSTIFAKLAGQWFSDNLSITDMKDSKTAAEKLAGNLIVEIAELAGMRKAEAETVKSFISRTEDKFRPAYGRVVETYPRDCIITASTNAQDGFLRDPTGNRRWWAVNVQGHGQADVHTMTPETINQIWAEAVHHEKAGEKLYLEGDAAQDALHAQAEAAESDDRTGLVAEYLEQTLPGNWDSLPLSARRVWLNDGMVPAEHAAPGIWDTGGLRGSVSKIEIWAECFGRDPQDMKRSDSYDISAIMAQIDGWEDSGERVRLPIYGRQRVFRRKRILALN